MRTYYRNIASLRLLSMWPWLRGRLFRKQLIYQWFPRDEWIMSSPVVSFSPSPHGVPQVKEASNEIDNFPFERSPEGGSNPPVARIQGINSPAHEIWRSHENPIPGI